MKSYKKSNEKPGFLRKLSASLRSEALKGLAGVCKMASHGLCVAAVVLCGVAVACSSQKNQSNRVVKVDVNDLGKINSGKGGKGGKDSRKNNNNNNRIVNNVRDNGNDKPVDKTAFGNACKKLGLTGDGVKSKELYIESASWIGVTYRYGGNTKSGTDCSGFTGQVYKKVYGKQLSRSSSAQFFDNCTKVSKSNLREGDLVFFRTDGKNSTTPNHVGLYLKENKFIHASSSRGVMVSSLEQDYYVRTFLYGGRVSM